VTDTERLDALLQIAAANGAIAIEAIPARPLRFCIPLGGLIATGIQKAHSPRDKLDEFIAMERQAMANNVIDKLEGNEPPF
jgi:hypothetical protein